MTMINFDRLCLVVIFFTSAMIGIIQPMVINEFNIMHAVFAGVAGVTGLVLWKMIAKSKKQ